MTDYDKRYYRAAEVAEMFDIEPSTLRYWEREIPQLKPQRSKGDHRRYSPADLELVSRIKQLLHGDGMGIAAAVKFLEQSEPPRQLPACKSDDDALKLLGRLRSIVSNNPKALSIIEAVEKYLLRSQCKSQ